jgi:hypothetical protein
MEFTPVYNLPCLSGTDYAAYALYLQCLAEQLDATLFEKQTELDSFRNRYAGVWRNTVAMVSASGSWNTTVPTVANLFWNDPVNPPSTGTAGSLIDPFRFNFPGAVAGGLYAVGGTVAMNQGATNGTYRWLSIDPVLFGSSGYVEALGAQDFSEETLSGGENLQTGFHVPLTLTTFTGLEGVPVGFDVSIFEDDAGNITIPVGGLTFWAVYIGDNTIIGGA